MVDVCRPATLQGFSVAVADIGDQMHLCQPLISFGGDPTLYFAHHLDWKDDPEALAIADRTEASTHGTILPQACRRPIASGEGVIAVGATFVHAAKKAEVELLRSEIHFAHIDRSSTRESGPMCSTRCWIGVAKPALYADLRTRLTTEARATFDEALGDAALHRGRLSEQGDAALFLMRKSGPVRRDDLAIRQLAGALQNEELDLYRRLLFRFSFELDAQEAVLDERARRHVAIAADRIGRDFERWLLQHPTFNFNARRHVNEQVMQHIGRVGDWKAGNPYTLKYFEESFDSAPSMFFMKSLRTLKEPAPLRILSGSGTEKRMLNYFGPIELASEPIERRSPPVNTRPLMGEPVMLRTKHAPHPQP